MPTSATTSTTVPSTSGGSNRRRIPSSRITAASATQRGAVDLRRQDLGALEAEGEAAPGRAVRQARRHQGQPDRGGVGEHVGGVGEQRERRGEDARHDLDGHEAEDQRERDPEPAAVAGRQGPPVAVVVVMVHRRDGDTRSERLDVSGHADPGRAAAARGRTGPARAAGRPGGASSRGCARGSAVRGPAARAARPARGITLNKHVAADQRAVATPASRATCPGEWPGTSSTVKPATSSPSRSRRATGCGSGSGHPRQQRARSRPGAGTGAPPSRSPRRRLPHHSGTSSASQTAWLEP